MNKIEFTVSKPKGSIELMSGGVYSISSGNTILGEVIEYRDRHSKKYWLYHNYLGINEDRPRCFGPKPKKSNRKYNAIRGCKRDIQRIFNSIKIV